MLSALKAHVLKERQRKKEEHEEERLRKEREARERQDEMTLGETREQILKLECKLKDLRNQKQSLFLQLKKVLNEDENRKKLQQQKDIELFAIQQMQQSQNMQHAQVFLPPRQAQQQILQKGGPLGHNIQGIKRGRSPSPPQIGYYKNSPYALSPKHEDGRRTDVSRVLWKQPPAQYQNPPGTLFYQTTANPPPTDNRPPQQIIYPPYNPAAMNIPMQHKPQVTMEKIPERGNYHEQQQQPQPPTLLPEGVVYAHSLIPGMPMHHNVMQQIQSTQNQQNSKTGSITQGYPPNRQPGGVHPQQQQPGQPQQQQQQQQQQQIHYQRRLF